MMKLTLVCLFLGVVVASPIGKFSSNGDTRLENPEDYPYMTTPSEPMISNGPVVPLPNGTHYPRPSHHKGTHAHGHGHHVSALSIMQNKFHDQGLRWVDLDQLYKRY